MTQPKELPLILAVDDEPANLALLERIFQGQYRVVSVTGGSAALDMLVQAPFDLILLDIMMPQMNGLETLEHIRKSPNNADTPVILISALSDAQDITLGLESGANDYITKPIDMDVTRARVQTQIALKLLQDERKRTIAELRAAQEMKDHLLRIASHDLKSPLMNLGMLTEILAESIDAIPNGEGLLDAAQSSIETMHNVIKDFLDTAALNTGVLDLKLQDIALPSLVTEIAAEHKINAVRKNITLQVLEVNGTIRADGARFRQSLGNLVSNAIKYSPANTTVKLWTEDAADGIAIYVADEGPGIPADEHGQLFTQFGKLSPRPTGGETSTGLGLWIVKHLIGLQSGEVGLISPTQGGSTFWIKMPRA